MHGGRISGSVGSRVDSSCRDLRSSTIRSGNIGSLRLTRRMKVKTRRLQGSVDVGDAVGEPVVPNDDPNFKALEMDMQQRNKARENRAITARR